MIEEIVGKGKIEAEAGSYVVTAPNGETFKGKRLTDSRTTLVEWWNKNGGRDTFREFDQALRRVCRKLTPNDCG